VHETRELRRQLLLLLLLSARLAGKLSAHSLGQLSCRSQLHGQPNRGPTDREKTPPSRAEEAIAGSSLAGGGWLALLSNRVTRRQGVRRP